MKDSNLDCILVGYNDLDLETVLGNFELMKASSGAFRYVLQNAGSRRYESVIIDDTFNVPLPWFKKLLLMMILPSLLATGRSISASIEANGRPAV